MSYIELLLLQALEDFNAQQVKELATELEDLRASHHRELSEQHNRLKMDHQRNLSTKEKSHQVEVTALTQEWNRERQVSVCVMGC